MVDHEFYEKNLNKLKPFIRRGQIIPCEVIKVLNDRDVIIEVKGLLIKAYTDLKLQPGDNLFLRIDQVDDPVRFKILSVEEYEHIKNSGLDITL